MQMKREVKATYSKPSTSFDRSAGQQTSDLKDANQAKLPKSILIAKPGSSSNKNKSRAGAPSPINQTKHGGGCISQTV